MSWSGSGRRPPPTWKLSRGGRLEDETQLGLRDRQTLARADEEGDARPAPVLDVQAQGGVGLGRGVGSAAVDVAVAVVLPAHVVGRVARGHRLEDRDHRVLERRGVGARRGLHRGGRHHLHQVVDDHVAQGADGVVEMAAVLDSEALGHRDLDRREVVAVPDRLEHRVGEPQEEDLDQPHLSQEVVDPVQLGLVEVLVDLLVERRRRGDVVPEGLLDHDTGRLGQTRAGEPLDHHPEQRRRDLEVEHRGPRALDGLGHALVGAVVPEVAGHVGEARREAIEDLVVDLLAAALDGGACVFAQVVHRPVVDRHADDRAVQQAAGLQPVQRVEGHDLGEVAGDAEDDEHVGGLRAAVVRARGGSLARLYRSAHVR